MNSLLVSKWPQPRGKRTKIRINYSFSPSFKLNGVKRNKLQHFSRLALATWASAGPFKFIQVKDSPNSRIRFQSKSLRLDEIMGGGVDYLAITGFPRGKTPIRFDTQNRWNRALYLETAVHEIGHRLGLPHISELFEGNAIMNGSIAGRRYRATRPYLLGPDVRYVRNGYGKGKGEVLNLNGRKVAQNIIRNGPRRPITASAVRTATSQRTSETIIPIDDTPNLAIQDSHHLESHGEHDNHDHDSSNSANEKISGSTGNDHLTGDHTPNWIIGRNGEDHLNGGRGNDILLGNRGRDRIFGQTGNDYLEGGSDADLLVGGNGDDILVGRSDNDRLKGGNGNDFLDGNSGANTLTGGAGQDTFALHKGAKTDRIKDFNLQEDQILLGSNLSFDDLRFDKNQIWAGNKAVVTLDGIQTSQLKASHFKS